ncbi:MAG TPA: hypothetical protein VN696_17570 [Pyrinomonadaceae bacterium]|nr:hypothetical protein [Pyrinomonadaceae bacterium]
MAIDRVNQRERHSQNSIATPSLAPTTTVEHVLNLLNSEIEEIQTAETRNGWNLWVILGAIAALVWLLTGEIAAGVTDWTSISRFVILQFLIVDGVRWLIGLFTSRALVTSDARFQWSSFLFSTSRLQAIIEIARAIGILILSFLSRSVLWYTLATISICYLVLIFLMTIMVILSYKPFAVSKARNKWTYFFMVTPLAAIVASVFPLFWRLHVPDFVSSFRISALIVALTYLVVLLGKTFSTSVATPVLLELRRNLVAGKISAPDAMKTIEVTLGGMEVADALRTNVVQIISLLERMDEQTRNAMMSLNAIESNLPTPGDDRTLVESKQNTVASLTAGYRLFLTERNKLAEHHQNQADQFFKNASRVQIVPTANHTIDEYVRILQSRAAETDKYFNKLVEREKEVGEKVVIAIPESTPKK